MSNFEHPNISCDKCLCKICAENVYRGLKSAGCSGCATCHGVQDDCPLDMFRAQEGEQPQ